MKYEVVIRWGMTSSGQEPVTYSFDTEAELTAFMLGVDECDGWLDYTIVHHGIKSGS